MYDFKKILCIAQGDRIASMMTILQHRMSGAYMDTPNLRV